MSRCRNHRWRRPRLLTPPASGHSGCSNPAFIDDFRLRQRGHTSQTPQTLLLRRCWSGLCRYKVTKHCCTTGEACAGLSQGPKLIRRTSRIRLTAPWDLRCEVACWEEPVETAFTSTRKLGTQSISITNQIVAACTRHDIATCITQTVKALHHGATRKWFSRYKLPVSGSIHVMRATLASFSPMCCSYMLGFKHTIPDEASRCCEVSRGAKNFPAPKPRMPPSVRLS